MDLVVLSSQIDFIAVKSGFCRDCLERKMNAKIIKVFPGLGFKEFMGMRKEYALQGFDVECVCVT